MTRKNKKSSVKDYNNSKNHILRILFTTLNICLKHIRVLLKNEQFKSYVSYCSPLSKDWT